MDAHQLAQARSEEIDLALDPARAPRQPDLELAFKDLFLRYVECCVKARKTPEIRLAPGIYDTARRRGLFSMVRQRFPDVKLYRKPERHPASVCVHE